MAWSDSARELLETQDVDDTTRSYILECLQDSCDCDECREILEGFLSEEVTQNLLALAFSGKEVAPSVPTNSSLMSMPLILGGTLMTSNSELPKESMDTAKMSRASKKAKQQEQNDRMRATTSKRSATQDRPLVTVRQSRLAEVVNQSLSIDVKDLSISFGGRSLLNDAHLRLLPGRYGFIGANGSGKSTLLRLMSTKSIPGYPNLETLLVEQEDVGDAQTPVQAVMSAHRLLARLKREASLLEEGLANRLCGIALLQVEVGRVDDQIAELRLDCARLVGERGKQVNARLRQAEAESAQLHKSLQEAQVGELMPAALEEECFAASCTSLLEEIKASLAELEEEKLRAKATSVLCGLGVRQQQLNEPTSNLSGGLRMRVALAKALFLEPQVLILDEPTNHLDWGSILWLEQHLAKLENLVLIVVSHDRQFLDNFATHILRLARCKLDVFKGNYSDYELTATQLHRKQEKYEEKNTSVGRVRRQRTDAVLEFERTVSLHLEPGPPLRYSGPLMQCRDVVVGFPGMKLTRPFDLSIDLSSRIAILGHNGCGKTTLLRTFAQDLPPLAGNVYVHHSLRVGYFSQHQAQALPLQKTPLELISAFGEGVREAEAEEHLASFGLDKRRVRQTIDTLSGGEKSRFALAQITIKRPHVLLLDEPSNHLDLLTVAALGEALKAFQGGILLVSHDRRLIKDICPDAHQQFLLDNGILRRADGLSKFVRSVKTAIAKDAHG